MDDETIKVITSGCHILLYLNLSHTKITDQSFRSLGRHCHFLQYLSLAYATHFTDRAFSQLNNGHGCRKVIYLDISGCTQLTSVGFDGLADVFRNLEVGFCHRSRLRLADLRLPFVEPSHGRYRFPLRPTHAPPVQTNE